MTTDHMQDIVIVSISSRRPATVKQAVDDSPVSLAGFRRQKGFCPETYVGRNINGEEAVDGSQAAGIADGSCQEGKR